GRRREFSLGLGLLLVAPARWRGLLSIVWLVDVPQSPFPGRGRGGEAGGRSREEIRGCGTGLARPCLLARRRANQVAQPHALGIRRAEGANGRDEKRAGAEVDRDDEPDHEATDEQRPGADRCHESDERPIHAISYPPA